MVFSCTSTSCKHFLAAQPPMLTWSSFPALVGIESTEAGCASVLFSETSAAAVQCAIMKPLWRPPNSALTRKAGRPDVNGFIMRSVRRCGWQVSSLLTRVKVKGVKVSNTYLANICSLVNGNGEVIEDLSGVNTILPYMVNRAITFEGYSPWKLPPEIISCLSANTIGLSVALFISVSKTRLQKATVSYTIPWT